MAVIGLVVSRMGGEVGAGAAAGRSVMVMMVGVALGGLGGVGGFGGFWEGGGG